MFPDTPAPQEPLARPDKEKNVMRAGEPGRGSDGCPTAPTAGGPQHSPLPWRLSMTGFSIKSMDDDMPIVANNPWGVAMKEKDAPRWIDNAEYIVRACNSLPDLLAALKETREAVAAAMRVVADLDVAHLLDIAAETRQQRFIDELKIAGVENGFGRRADAAIAKAEGR